MADGEPEPEPAASGDDPLTAAAKRAVLEAPRDGAAESSEKPRDPRRSPRAVGIAATGGAGQVTLREGEPTGARPGRLLRNHRTRE